MNTWVPKEVEKQILEEFRSRYKKNNVCAKCGNEEIAGGDYISGEVLCKYCLEDEIAVMPKDTHIGNCKDKILESLCCYAKPVWGLLYISEIFHERWYGQCISCGFQAVFEEKK